MQKIESKETFFIYKIDCQFPYLDTEKAMVLIDESLELKPDSTYKVIEELCRIPASNSNNAKILKQADMLLDYLDGKFSHPLKSLIMKVAQKLKSGKYCTKREVLNNFELIKPNQWQASALSIVYYSSEYVDDDDEIENAYDNISEYWQQVDDLANN